MNEAALRAVILAAGRSSRMGFPKALLPFEGEVALDRVIRRCRDAGLSRPLVVLGFHAEKIREEALLHGADVVQNPHPEPGPTSSLQQALPRLQEGEGLCLFPVDHAGVQAETVAQLVAAYRQRAAGVEIVVPSFEQRRGHPALFAPPVVAELRALEPGEPAHRVVRRDPGRIHHVVVSDAAVVRDFDTPQDWSRRDA